MGFKLDNWEPGVEAYLSEHASAKESQWHHPNFLRLPRRFCMHWWWCLNDLMLNQHEVMAPPALAGSEPDRLRANEFLERVRRFRNRLFKWE